MTEKWDLLVLVMLAHHFKNGAQKSAGKTFKYIFVQLGTKLIPESSFFLQLSTVLSQNKFWSTNDGES